MRREQLMSTSKHHKLPCKYCSSSDAVTQYLDNGMFKCHKCKKFWWLKDGKTPILSSKEYNDEKFPKDFTYNIPEEYKNWYHQYGLTDYDCCHFGWSNQYQRIIIPIDYWKLDHECPEWDMMEIGPGDKEFECCICDLGNWIGRSVHPDQYKMHNPRGQRWKPYRRGYAAPTLVITEDVLSAIKVFSAFRNHHQTLALLGSYQPAKELKKIDNWHFIQKIFIWLDGDLAGIKGARRLYNELSMTHCCDIIETSKDPKEYSLDEIRDILYGKR